MEWCDIVAELKLHGWYLDAVVEGLGCAQRGYPQPVGRHEPNGQVLRMRSSLSFWHGTCYHERVFARIVAAVVAVGKVDLRCAWGGL